jgi:hypothetical protein
MYVLYNITEKKGQMRMYGSAMDTCETSFVKGRMLQEADSCIAESQPAGYLVIKSGDKGRRASLTMGKYLD